MRVQLTKVLYIPKERTENIYGVFVMLGALIRPYLKTLLDTGQLHC